MRINYEFISGLLIGAGLTGIGFGSYLVYYGNKLIEMYNGDCYDCCVNEEIELSIIKNKNKEMGKLERIDEVSEEYAVDETDVDKINEVD